MPLRGELIEMLSRMDDESFGKLCGSLSVLLGHGLVVKGHILSQDAVYRTLIREIEGARRILQIFGMQIESEPLQGYVRLVDPERRCAVQFTKDESVVLVLLRLLLHERSGQTSYDKDVTITIGDIRESYLQHAGEGARGFPMGILSNALRYFQRLNLVKLDRPFEANDAALIHILPTVYAVISPGDADKASKLLARYLEARAEEAAEGGEVPEDPDGTGNSAEATT